jgi:hypothetical protein
VWPSQLRRAQPVSIAGARARRFQSAASAGSELRLVEASCHPALHPAHESAQATSDDELLLTCEADFMIEESARSKSRVR